MTSGLVCDRGLTLGDLIGVFNDFFGRLGNFNFLSSFWSLFFSKVPVNEALPISKCLSKINIQ